ncbi:bifunctional DNA-binding transcriptional regulator/O6-methylguanine-DNA methyltransferase Ada [Blastomonas sp.]|uniref:bifunctional DNA-binding transcriptional regulator/O6-methylguanine-DNA methyltransferase Ada n=1 Tax=Blastomonas sp. TaxID=1909299 RepID=UPI00263225B9|nr:bifunctional DNA-binding transcriptional regulator/O6-methylguanine-DNA methyltransferase Ada [Blastomonas sp.]MDM7956265.1 bifunctional DNA-binding transcriptional regulator/O6-methylguanine-DNA methyltransferase Ada [Blastomonas sp.]
MMTQTMIDDGTAWQAVQRRDRSFDGRFVTGVLTTGIYCRPSCAARHPARGNVRFFVDGAAARAAGLRACKRCLPDDVARDETAVLAAIAAIRASEEPLALAALADTCGYSPAHFQRLFTRHTGLSPAGYARALRQERAREALSSQPRVVDAIYEAGFSAPSRFYGSMKGRIGMAPSVWKSGGAGVDIHWTQSATSLGLMLVAWTDKGVCRLSFEEGPEALAARFPAATLHRADGEAADLLAGVIARVEAPATSAAVPLDVRGTVFQEAVWQALADIPAGETRSYAQIAASIGSPKAVRAVGSACGANPVAVLIPCHRALRTDGTLGGYAYGLPIKTELLKRESD